MKFKKLGKSLLMVGLAACLAFGSFACGKKGKDKDTGGGTNVDQTPTKLGNVTVVISGATASWTAVENASGYEYSFDNGATFTFTTETSVEIPAGKTVIVRAAGDGVNYRHGNWSTVSGGGDVGGGDVGGGDTQATQLSAPVVSLNGETASWEAVANASGYVYKIGESGAENNLPASVTSFALQDGQTLYVKAKGDGTNYSDSAWSNAVTYTAPAVGTEQLATPQVWLEGNVAKWSTVEHATAYKYKHTETYPTIDTTTENSIVLRDGQSLWVCATSSDSNYTDSPWSNVVTFNKTALPTPIISINNNVVSWTAVTGATGYIVKVNGVASNVDATTLSYTLSASATVTVVAVGDDVLTKNSEESTSVSYTKPMNSLAAPTISITGKTVSWSAIANASGYIVNVDGVDKPMQTATSYTLTGSATVKVKAVGDNTNYSDSEWSMAKTYTQTLVNSCDAYGQEGQIRFWVESNATTSLEASLKTEGGFSIKLEGNAWQYINLYMRDSSDAQIPLTTLATYDYISVDVYNAGTVDVVLYYKDQVTEAKTIAAGQWTTLTFSAAEISQWFGDGYCTFFLQQDGVTLYFDNINACKVS